MSQGNPYQTLVLRGILGSVAFEVGVTTPTHTAAEVLADAGYETHVAVVDVASRESVQALVATAIGLFAAIPAVLAYNRFSHDIDRIANRLETFTEEFSNILQRNVGASSAPATPAAR